MEGADPVLVCLPLVTPLQDSLIPNCRPSSLKGTCPLSSAPTHGSSSARPREAWNSASGPRTCHGSRSSRRAHDSYVKETKRKYLLGTLPRYGTASGRRGLGMRLRGASRCGRGQGEDSVGHTDPTNHRGTRVLSLRQHTAPSKQQARNPTTSPFRATQRWDSERACGSRCSCRPCIPSLSTPHPPRASQISSKPTPRPPLTAALPARSPQLSPPGEAPDSPSRTA